MMGDDCRIIESSNKVMQSLRKEAQDTLEAPTPNNK